MVKSGQALITQNPGLFHNTELLTTSTSIDSLSPDSPVFPAMFQAPHAPWITYHNIVGMTTTKKFFKEVEATGDGVVSFESAHADDAVTEITVNDKHQEIHRNPKSILEVRRILIEHLTFLRAEFRAEQLAAAEGRNRSPNNAGQVNSALMADSASEAIQNIQTIGVPKRPAPTNLLNMPATTKSLLNGTSRKSPSL
jgi:hypothetical protein